MPVVIDRPAPASDVTPALEIGDTLEVDVTPDDIAQGRRNASDRCPFSLALQRAGYSSPSVGYSGVFVGRVRSFFKHTVESHAWVRTFDNGAPVAPERFVLHRQIIP